MPGEKLSPDDVYVLRYVYDHFRRERVYAFHTAASIQQTFSILHVDIDPAIGLGKLASAGLLNDHQNGTFTLSPEGLVTATEMCP